MYNFEVALFLGSSDDKKLSDELGDAAMESEEDGRKEMTATSPTEASQGKRYVEY